MANPPPSSATAIIDPRYCAPASHPVDLIITKERTRRDNFTVTDINGNIVLTVKSSLVTFVTPRQHLFLLDAYGNPIVHLRRALLAANDSWKAFRGESEEPKDLIFIRKRSSSMFHLRTKLNVFLANNTTEVCDFKVKANLSGTSWDVYKGESDTTVVAQINKKLGTIFSREKFMVTVCPNIDYAFIVALIVTFD
ncbi:protein LURP-one-related 15-like [Gastrolobium bilobum]|uniref:protein LURP-one-related 15-like n=1 Tax=Gastrolobium bilobum TaxID=150636 RepID=UPI002AAF1737|nr:protein LURP-one-related 15-like [Gastrolobium bilobum]